MRNKSRYVHEGRHVAEVEAGLLEDNNGWFLCFSVEDSYKLDDVREDLRQGDQESAAKYGQIYKQRPVAHQ